MNKELLKFHLAHVFRALWKPLGLFFPVRKNRILFDSFLGKQYSCNPRALYEYFFEHLPEDTEYIWALRNPEQFQWLNQQHNTRVCRYRSMAHYMACLTSKFVIFNFARSNELPMPKGQIRIQTWHGGGCYKKTGTAILSQTDVHNRILRYKAKEITHFLSSSQFFTEQVIRKQYAFDGPVLSTGMPRNDLLLHEEQHRDKRKKIRQDFLLAPEDFFILYAPTYRDFTEKDYAPLDFFALKDAVEQRFKKKARVYYRGHHYTKQSGIGRIGTGVGGYFDMQDLLLAADMLITAYSSSIWDFSFTPKPCFLYVPDLEDYEAYRGFDRDIHTWGFPLAKDNNSLCQAILSFDYEETKANMDKHHRDLNSFEQGDACKQVTDFLLGL